MGKWNNLDLLIIIQDFLSTVFIHTLFSVESIGIVGKNAESGDRIPVLASK